MMDRSYFRHEKYSVSSRPASIRTIILFVAVTSSSLIVSRPNVPCRCLFLARRFYTVKHAFCFPYDSFSFPGECSALILMLYIPPSDSGKTHRSGFSSPGVISDTSLISSASDLTSSYTVAVFTLLEVIDPFLSVEPENLSVCPELSICFLFVSIVFP
ncbi:hypothetical protein MTP99_002909 [Tenebrio molitor]|jgi:hypothetical protein|nr:hypothetical protein MTP99_002909 [Tenebrio molitor]